MKLSELRITKEDFASTYADGADIYRRYQTVMAAHEDGMTGAEIHRQYGFPRKTTYNWINENPDKRGKPYCIKGVEAIDDIVGLPFSQASPAFGLTNIISAQTYWRGSIPENATKPSSGNAVIGIKDEIQERIITKVLEAIDCSYTTEDHMTRNSPQRILHYDDRLGRLIQLLGYPQGAVRDTKLILLKQVQASQESLKDLSDCDSNLRMARDTIRNHILALLHLRMKHQWQKKYANLVTFKERKNAEKHAKLICELANITLAPAMQFAFRINRSSDGHWVPRLTIKTDLTPKEVSRIFEVKVDEMIAA